MAFSRASFALSRRHVLSLAASAVAGAAASSVLVAGGGSDATEFATRESAGPASGTNATTTESGSGINATPNSSVVATPGAQTPSAPHGGTLHVVYAEEPVNLHPQIQSGTEGWYVQKQIIDGLVNIGGNSKIIPGLATDRPEHPDELTYIFHLRENVTFHNGKPFTADDVIWTFDRLLGTFPDLLSSQATRFKDQIAGVEKIDERTVKVTLAKPWPDYLPLMASAKYLCIMQKDAELEAGKDYGQTVVVGTGPFKFKEWITGDHLTLVRNDDYWGEPACVDQIIYKAIPEDATRMACLAAGEIDILLTPALKDVKKYEDDPKYNVLTTDGGNLKMVVFNTTRAPFNEVKVRQAVDYAIDRQEIVDSIDYGYATVAQDLLPAWNPAHDPNRSYYPYDPDKAKQLLAEAGYDSDNPLEFELVATDATEFTDLATLIQAQLDRIGVNVSVLPLDKSALYAKTFPTNGTANPGFQAEVYSLIYGLPTTDYTYRTYHPSSTISQSGYNQPGGAQNPDVLKLLDESASTSDIAKQKERFGSLSDLINEDVPAITMAIQKNVISSRAAVTNLGITVLSVMPLKDVCIAQ